jgi:MSHA biogenesis protein MshO
MQSLAFQRGFTLIEMVMVIVIMGVMGGMVAIFMKSPIDAYFASARRAGMTDTADLAVRRMARDIQKALPNSLSTPSDQCIEFVATKTGARYREQDISPGDGTSLSFTALDNQFNMLGSNLDLPPDQRIAAGDVVVVYNLGIPGSSAYQQDNTATVTAVGTPTTSPSVETPITTTTSRTTPLLLASDSKRFHVIAANENIVSYVCSAGNLHRTVRPLDALGAATPAPTCPASGPVLARNLSTCYFDYGGSDLGRNALVRMVLTLTENTETVTLQHEVHVRNTP